MTRPGKMPKAKPVNEPGSLALESDALTTSRTRRCKQASKQASSQPDKQANKHKERKKGRQTERKKVGRKERKKVKKKDEKKNPKKQKHTSQQSHHHYDSHRQRGLEVTLSVDWALHTNHQHRHHFPLNFSLEHHDDNR